METYFIGTKIQLDATFKDSQGQVADPTAVAAEIRLPDLSVVDLSGTIVQVSTGVYRAEYTLVQNGLHAFRFEGTGVIEAAGEGSLMSQSTFT